MTGATTVFVCGSRIIPNQRNYRFTPEYTQTQHDACGKLSLRLATSEQSREKPHWMWRDSINTHQMEASRRGRPLRPTNNNTSTASLDAGAFALSVFCSALTVARELLSPEYKTLLAALTDPDVSHMCE